jgi:hypothetical protein
MGFQGPMPPPIPPELMDKIQGLERIIKAIKLIRDEKLRGFRVEIEVESTIYGDAQQEKGDRTAFIAAVTQFMQQSMQISMMMPEAAPLLGKFLQFGVRGQKVGRELEQAIEDFCDEAVHAAKQHQQNAASQPNPEQIKANAMMAKSQADIQSAQMKMQTDKQSAQAEVQRQQIENQGEAQNAQQDTVQKQMDMEMRKLEMQIELVRLQMEKMKAEAAIQVERQKAQTTQHESYIDQQQSALGHVAETQKTFMEGAMDHHKMKMEADQTEQERLMQQESMDHDRRQAKMQHQIAKTKLQQQKVSASRPRTTQ